MKRYLALLILLASPLITEAVCTPDATHSCVTATITDTGSQTWNSGTYTFTFIPNGNGPWSLGGAPYTPVPLTGSMDASGVVVSFLVPRNSLIKPVGSFWKVTVCPKATSPCFLSGLIQ